MKRKISTYYTESFKKKSMWLMPELPVSKKEHLGYPSDKLINKTFFPEIGKIFEEVKGSMDISGADLYVKEGHFVACDISPPEDNPHIAQHERRNAIITVTPATLDVLNEKELKSLFAKGLHEAFSTENDAHKELKKQTHKSGFMSTSSIAASTLAISNFLQNPALEQAALALSIATVVLASISAYKSTSISNTKEYESDAKGAEIGGVRNMISYLNAPKQIELQPTNLKENLPKLLQDRKPSTEKRLTHLRTIQREEVIRSSSGNAR